MEMTQYFKNLSVPEGRIDVVLDTDTFNEVDDQFAIAYMIRSEEKINVKAICAAPFFCSRSTSPKDGMEKSYDEIKKVLKLADREDLFDRVYKGSDTYLPDEKTPVESDTARYLAEIAEEYTPEKPLYIVAIGAITNIASAILLNPKLVENAVVVWLGGNALEIGGEEFNMMQDIAAARVVFASGVPLVQLPCKGIVSAFAITAPELDNYFMGKNRLTDYLAGTPIEEAKAAVGYPWTWSRIIWDVTAIGWLLNDNERFMQSKVIKKHMPNYDNQYNLAESDGYMQYVYYIKRDALLADLVDKLTK